MNTPLEAYRTNCST